MLSNIRATLSKIFSIFRRSPLERDLDDEIQDHLRRLEERFRTRGMSSEQAHTEARRAFGGVDKLKEEHRDAAGISFVDGVRRDLGYAFRVLRKNPAFACVAIISLTVGIGAN